MKNLTSRLYLSNQTVFRLEEIALLWRDTDPVNLRSKINYYVKSGILKSPRRGIYTLTGKAADPFELATRIFIPSYISLETVLAKEGIIFQYYENISVISYQTRAIEIGSFKFVYHKISLNILSNPAGIDILPSYSIASKERAFLDTLYLSGKPYFDNLNRLDWNLCRRLLPVYNNQSLNLRFNKYAKS